MLEQKVRKKNGNIVPWDEEKLLAAVNQSAERCREGGHLSDDEEGCFLALVEKEVARRNIRILPTSILHLIVEKKLEEIAPDVGRAYREYRNFRIEQAKRWEKIKMQCNSAVNSGDQQNANADSTLASTLKCFTADYTETELVNEYLFTEEEKEAFRKGYLYAHDKNGLRIYPYNCCLLRVGDVMKNGFQLNNIRYTEPKRLNTAFSVMADIIFIVASQQYGGCTAPRVDSILAPYAEYTYQEEVEKLVHLGVMLPAAQKAALESIKKIARQGFQEWEMKFNTVASSRGDYPFVTITGGIEDEVYPSGYAWGPILWEAALEVRKNGQGPEGFRKPVLFPKIVFLYDENKHGKGQPLEWLFEKGIETSAKTMYPDWLSLTGEGYISSMYKKYGVDGVISPMGCRAFLSPWYEKGEMNPADENDKPVYEGRFNIGVISLHLPMILQKSRLESKDFYEVLDYYLEMIRKILDRRYRRLAQIPASRNPIMFCEGGAYMGHLKPTDKIEPLLKYATASFGITALNELQRLYNGKSLVEDGTFALEVMEHINDFVNRAKKEDGHLYAIYGTPAEKLCGLQARQFRDMYGIIEGVSDKEYVSNSFHCHVTEDISPIQKQDLEYRFWEMFNGGKIQYCRYPLGYNIEAMRTLIRRAMKMGLYEGVNLSLSYCNDCGHEELEMGETCPICNSKNITQIDRMNGYLGYTRQGTSVKGYDSTKNNRFAHHKLIEINERKSM